MSNWVVLFKKLDNRYGPPHLELRRCAYVAPPPNRLFRKALSLRIGHFNWTLGYGQPKAVDSMIEDAMMSLTKVLGGR